MKGKIPRIIMVVVTLCLALIMALALAPSVGAISTPETDSVSSSVLLVDAAVPETASVSSVVSPIEAAVPETTSVFPVTLLVVALAVLAATFTAITVFFLYRVRSPPTRFLVDGSGRFGSKRHGHNGRNGEQVCLLTAAGCTGA